ncbi:MAG: cell division protein FtsZ [Sphingomonadales bacterium]|nr:MAG: cell division protein FtsZ [Sphingomonadales bacterium]
MGIELMNPPLTELAPRITVIGVGGAGGNAVNNMIRAGLTGVDFLVANTDAQALSFSETEKRIQLGLKITQGLGAGARPEIGRAAAEETLNQIEEVLDGAHMCFIAAGMGGGTGTGAAPVLARAAREKGILTVGVVTKPFMFEGQRRMRLADEGIAELQKYVDTLIIIPNQNLFRVAGPQTTFKQAFVMADDVLLAGVRGITDLMIMPGLINLDFADIRTVMSEMGKAMMGTGEASGENRAIEAAQAAIANPLLDEVSMRGAKGVIINITGGDDLGLFEVDEAANHIREMVDADAHIIVGSAFSPDLNGVMRVSVVATGIDAAPAKAETPMRPTATPARPVPGFSAPGSLSGARVTPIRTPAPEPVQPPVLLEEAIVEPQPVIAETVDEELTLDRAQALSDEPAANAFEPVVVPPQPAIDAEERRYPPERSRAAQRHEPRAPTLFERMMGIRPSGSGAQEPLLDETPPPVRASQEEEDDSLEIPRFFRRQAN